jgi:hypothetical protein
VASAKSVPATDAVAEPTSAAINGRVARTRLWGFGSGLPDVNHFFHRQQAQNLHAVQHAFGDEEWL